MVLRLLWGKAPAPTRGPKARLALADIVTTAVALVDREGLAALTTRRVAEELGISLATLKRDWTFAKAWLYDALAG